VGRKDYIGSKAGITPNMPIMSAYWRIADPFYCPLSF
jgi:hypothetical protein